MVYEEELKKFFDTLNNRNPNFYFKSVEIDVDVNKILLVFNEYLSSTHFYNKMSDEIPEVLFELRRRKSLNEINDNYIQVLYNEISDTIESYKHINVSNTEFWFLRTTKINYKKSDDGIHESLNELEERYFKEIMAYSNLRYEFSQQLKEGLNDILNDVPINTKKLEIKLSVPEIALLFRLLGEEKLIRYKHKTEIYRFIASSIKTEKQENISEASVKNKFLTPDLHSIDKLKILLTNMKVKLVQIENDIAK